MNAIETTPRKQIIEPRMRNGGMAARPLTPPPAPQKSERPQKNERPPEKPVEFSLSRPQARTVGVAGTFNNWDSKRHPMQKEGSRWKATILLAPGRYEYRFVADGQWFSDPNAKDSNQNPFGSTNSVLVV